MVTRGAVAFGCGILYARSLGPEGRGEVALAITTAGSIGLGVNLVCVPSLVRVRLSGAWRDGQLKTQAIALALFGSMPLAAAAAVVLALSRSGAPLDGLLLYTLVLAAATSLIYVAQGIGEGRRAAWWGTAGALAAGSVTAALSLAGWLTPRSAVLVFCLVYAVPLLGLLPGGGARFPRARSDLRLQASTAASAPLVLLLWRGDVYLVAGLLSTGDLGVYAVGVAVAEVTQVVLSGLRAALTPRVRPLTADDVPVALFARLNQLTVLLLGAAALALAVAGRPLFEVVYGREFGEGAAIALVLLPGMWGFIAVSTYLETLQISGEGRFAVLALGGALLANVLINLALTRRFGLLVPAASSTACYLGLGLLLVRRVSHTSGIPLRRLLWPAAQVV